MSSFRRQSNYFHSRKVRKLVPDPADCSGCRESRDEALLAEIAGNYDDEDKPLKEAYLEQFTR